MYIYDNPDTNCRELYSHGHLIVYFVEAQVEYAVRHGYINDHYDPVRIMYEKEVIRHGRFREGAEYGDTKDKPDDPLATQIYED